MIDTRCKPRIRFLKNYVIVSNASFSYNKIILDFLIANNAGPV